MKILTLILLMFSVTGMAQHNRPHRGITIDTTFNIRSEFQKQVKYYPQITVADADTTNLTVRHNLVYTNYGRRKLHLDMFLPPYQPSEKLPVIVLVHGGGWRSGNKSLDWPLAAALAKKGFVTVCAEYRLSVEALFPTAIIDIKTAVRWLRANTKHFPVDTAKIILLGTSAGGQIASFIGSQNGAGKQFKPTRYRKFSERVQAVVDIDGVLAFIHPESGEGADKPGKPSAATLWLGASSTENPALWQLASPISQVNQLTAPFLFINSAQPRFHAGRDDMIKKLDALDIKSQVITIPETPHTFWLFNPWFETTVNTITHFVNNTYP